jgi:ATP-dependent Clp protease ATP-binding subunit ClpX
MDNVEIEFGDDALKAVAEKSIDRKTGARGLRSIMEEIMTDIMYEIPSRKDLKKVIIKEKCITEKAEPKYVTK